MIEDIPCTEAFLMCSDFDLIHVAVEEEQKSKVGAYMSVFDIDKSALNTFYCNCTACCVIKQLPTARHATLCDDRRGADGWGRATCASEGPSGASQDRRREEP